MMQTTDSSMNSTTRQEFEIIWYTVDIEEADGSHLLQAFDYARIISDPEECTQLITSIGADQKFFLILTDEYGLSLLNAFRSKCTKIYFVDIHDVQLKDSTMFCQVFQNFKEVIRQLRIDIRMACEDHLQLTLLRTNAQSIQQLDKESAQFIWFHALLDAIRVEKEKMMKSTRWYNIEKNEMLTKCRQECDMNMATLKKIDTFNDLYKSSDAIKWYAEDTFIYRSINKALRSNTIEEIIGYRFFIVDLHDQLKLLCEEQFCEMSTVATVYRGQGVLPKQLDLLKSNIGNLITIKSFLSTSWDKTVARDFVFTQIDRPGVEPVLFEMKIDTNVREKPFAYIAEFTPMNEEEVLLSMGFVFRIEQVRFDRAEQFWFVELSSEPENDQIKELLKYTKDKDSKQSLAHVLYAMGEYTTAIRYLKWLLTKADKNDQTINQCNASLALNYKALDQYDSALACIQNSSRAIFETEFEHSFIQSGLGNFYYTLGLVYLGEGDYSLAIYTFHMFLEEMRTIANKLRAILKEHVAYQEGWEWMDTWQGNQDILGKVYNNLGSAYSALKQYRAAYRYFSKALQIQEKWLPKQHYHLAVSYINLGRLHKDLSNNEEALRYFTKSLEIYKISRQVKHFSIRNAYLEIGQVYEMKRDYTLALQNYENVLNHAVEMPEVIEQLMNIARIYHKLKQHQQAISVSEKAARLCREHSLPMTHLFANKDNVMIWTQAPG